MTAPDAAPIVPGPNLNGRTRQLEIFFTHERLGGAIAGVTLTFAQVQVMAAQITILDHRARENAEARAAGAPAPHEMPDGWSEPAEQNGRVPSNIVIPNLVLGRDVNLRRGR